VVRVGKFTGTKAVNKSTSSRKSGNW